MFTTLLILVKTVSLTNKTAANVERECRTSEGPLSRENEGRGVTSVCLVHYPWMRPKLFRDSWRMHFGPRTQRKGTVSHFVALKFTDPVSAYSLQSLLGFFFFLEPPQQVLEFKLASLISTSKIPRQDSVKQTNNKFIKKWINQLKYGGILSFYVLLIVHNSQVFIYTGGKTPREHLMAILSLCPHLSPLLEQTLLEQSGHGDVPAGTEVSRLVTPLPRPIRSEGPHYESQGYFWMMDMLTFE